MKRIFSILVILSILLGGFPAPANAALPKRAFKASDIDLAVIEAVKAQLAEHRMEVLGLALFDPVVDSIQYSQDGTTALAWIKLIDTETAQVVETEPGLTVAHLRPGEDPVKAASWEVVLHTSEEWLQERDRIPADLLPPEAKELYFAEQPPMMHSIQAAFTGYKLPWAAGLKKRLTQSIGHIFADVGGYVSCQTTCRYAYDFADGTMFPLVAAKGGTIKYVNTTCANGSTTCTNYLVIEDRSTTPVSYQLYYHMAYESVPARLRVVGTPVLQGEFIGNVDDTGASTGHHLHFHVFTSATGQNWSWGPSVDFKFDDVTDNGGYPRLCGEASKHPDLGTDCSSDSYYTSGNVLAHMPGGSLTVPANRDTITSQTFTVGGSASSDNGLAKISVFGRWDGATTEITSFTPAGNGAFASTVDVCSKNIPDGPLDLSVVVYDRAGGQVLASPGVIHMFKNFSCGVSQVPPPPACVPGANQVSLYEGADFTGTCSKFDVGDNGSGFPVGKSYIASALSPVGDNKTSSVQVGSGVRAVLFDVSDDPGKLIPTGRIETLTANDANLADNRIGAGRVSGLLVQPLSDGADEAFLTAPGPKWDGSNPTTFDSLVLAWNGGEGAATFDVSITSLSGQGITRSWADLATNAVSAGSLPAGNYNFHVTAKNNSGVNNSDRTFTVAADSRTAPAAVSVPFFNDFETTTAWSATGLWRLASATERGRATTKAWIYNNTTAYADGAYRGGDLTSPPMQLPSASTSYLTFKYFYTTEGDTPYWDQRLVQVVKQDGTVVDLMQQGDDREIPDQYWLTSSPISLAAFKGQTVRIRFHFDTVDAFYNSGPGWMVDDVNVNSTGPASGCGVSGNNSPATAAAITIGAAVPRGQICPQGEIDYYKFNGTVGQAIAFNIEAKTLGSSLDSVLYLLDGDGRSLLTWDDDKETGVNNDPYMTYVLRRTGTYYLKLKAWNTPAVGGSNFFYDLSTTQLVGHPPRLVSFLSPAAPNRVPNMPFELKAYAEDYDGGPVARVDFYYHGPDWNTDWVKLGSDTNGADGWSMMVNPALYGQVNGSAVYILAFNAGGPALGQAMFDLSLDPGIPSSSVNSMPSVTRSTAINLTWTAADDDLSHFDFQYQADSGAGFGAWQDLNAHPLGYERSLWFTGTAGYRYNFRMRAVDLTGNAEPYPSTPDATTQIQSACSGDAFDPADGTAGGAVAITPWVQQQHTFCQNDVDWISFTTPYPYGVIQLRTRTGGAAFTAELYNASGAKVAAFQSQGVATNTGLNMAPLKLPAATYKLKLMPYGGIYGTDVTYEVLVIPSPGYIYLPQVGK